ncbi:peptidoglycan DD-metalloendopeptidase family protein [Oceanobacillus chungangensis]|uniref:M23 family peptidase n=1 Tax=Oceanobacillus chungangensis TaxID=1229152 RepID=A0A3D8Q243_9BACI|nr:peptidoglycan DD-metalloendopeptidase family protein [Oceanobacillus chungangensis]RDW21668.1 M23 family peptidase [Oceanobacillus chungangensis]
MTKGVNKVRKSIEQRKKLRGVIPKDNVERQIFPSLPEEEEKHGYYPVFSDTSSSKGGISEKPVSSGIILRALLSTMLFFGIALLWQLDSSSLQGPKLWTSSVLEEEFPFAKVNVWYRDTFGAPLAFSPEKVDNQSQEILALPVSGDITEPFSGEGIRIEPGEAANVSVLHEGIVIFAGNDRDTNKTVVVQHADDSISSYGFLSEIDVHLYQYVGNNQRVGQFTPTEESETVYFSIEKDNQYLDPVQVIQVDDLR